MAILFAGEISLIPENNKVIILDKCFIILTYLIRYLRFNMRQSVYIYILSTTVISIHGEVYLKQPYVIKFDCDF